MTRDTAAGLGHVLGVLACVAIGMALFAAGWLVLGTLWTIRCIWNWISMAGEAARERA
jgi:hypothetical protein